MKGGDYDAVVFWVWAGEAWGSVKMWNARVVELWKETLERPFSIVRVVRWKTLVRTRPSGLRKDSMVADIWITRIFDNMWVRIGK